MVDRLQQNIFDRRVAFLFSLSDQTTAVTLWGPRAAFRKEYIPVKCDSGAAAGGAATGDAAAAECERYRYGSNLIASIEGHV